MDKEPKPVKGQAGSPEPTKLSRRELLGGLGKWSAAVVAAVCLEGALSETESEADAAWFNGGVGWINRRGGWANGGGWLNGGGSWLNHPGGWIDGGWYNGSHGGWINNRGGGSWVNRRGGGGWINRR